MINDHLASFKLRELRNVYNQDFNKNGFTEGGLS